MRNSASLTSNPRVKQNALTHVCPPLSLPHGLSQMQTTDSGQD
jgi:hypothetical protein